VIEKVKHKGLALLLLAAAQFMVVLDVTIVNVALPAVQSALHFASQADLQWIVTAYGLAYGGFLLLGGKLADLFGRKRMLLIGLSLFAAASLLGGLSVNPGMLIAMRVVQGLGAALLSPAALSLVLTIFSEGKERNKALGAWSMVAAGGGAVGLLLGGLLTQYVGWEWNFFVNVPVAVIVGIAISRTLPETIKQEGKKRIDVLGALTVTGGLMSVVYALAQVPKDGWGSTTVIGFFALAAVLLITFVINELKVKQPLMNLGILKDRNVAGGTLMQFLLPAAMFGMFFYLSIYLQQLQHFTPVQTGLADLPIALTIAVVAAFVSRKLAGKVSPKTALTIAPLIVAAGLLYLVRLPLNASYWTDILPAMIVIAAGMAVTFVMGTMQATSGVSHKEAGVVSGLLNTANQMGGAVGLAVLSVISANQTKVDMAAAHGAQAALPNALMHGFHSAFATAAAFGVAAAVIAGFVLVHRKPTQADEARKLEVEAESLIG